jgi:outer membrane biosynthesis protein TonB
MKINKMENSYKIKSQSNNKLIDKLVNSNGSDKRKSIILSLFLYGTMLLILFFIRFWPPSNLAELTGGGGGGGVSVNFGDSDLGMGNDFQNEEKVVKNQAKPIPVKEIQEEQDVIAEENSKDEGVVIPKKVNVKKVKEVIIKETKPVVITKPVKETPKTPTKPQNDALSNILKGSKTGDGTGKTAGNQGSANGGLNNSGYGAGGSSGGTGGGNGSGNGTGTGTGSGSGTGGGSGSGSGKGSGAGYSLGDRKALSKPAPAYNCDEVGKVVVQITVDKNGKTISATPGIKGTTNTAKCLLDQAKIAAMNTKWSADENALEQQVGKIEYNFKLN